MESALEGRRLARVPALLENPLAEVWANDAGLPVLRLALRLGHEPARQRALQAVADPKRLSQADRISLIEVLAQTGGPDVVPALVRLFAESEPEPVRLAALSAMQAFADPAVAEAILSGYSKLSSPLKSRAQALLFSRPASSLGFLRLVEENRVAAKEVPLDQVRRALLHKQAEIDRLVEKHWGKVGPETGGEKQARIRYLITAVRAGKGDPALGKPLFTKHCSNCHTLFNEGAKIGPDLTGADRKNLDFLLTHIIDPNLAIRPEYLAHTVLTKDGRVLTGLVVEAAPGAVTLVDSNAEKSVVAREKIDEMKPSPVSLMAERLLDTLTDQQVRDLISYVQSEEPRVASK
jgi:putative heme-binding domain-containing protein